MINTLSPIRQIQGMQVQYVQPVAFQQPDTVKVENPYVNKKPLIDRRIIKPDENINEFFDKISAQVFKNSNMSPIFAQMLKYGYVSLSSACYENINTPFSARAVKLNPDKLPSQNCAKLEEYVKDGTGVGINFNEFKNPVEQIKQINNYFKFRQSTTIRPPAGIALLSVKHPAIIDFIKLKDNADYNNWCFDLSVVADDKFLSMVDTNQNIEMFDGTKMPAKEIYNTLLNSIQKSGEPGIVFSNNPNIICDCCNATELREDENLTLAHINLSKFYNPKTGRCDCDFLKYTSDVLAHAVRNIDKNGFIGVMGYQELINQMGLKYGTKEANQVLEDCLTIIKLSGCKMALSPTGTTSRILKTTPSIEPSDNKDLTYKQEIDTMACAQKYLEGGISKTIKLKQGATTLDIDEIIRYAKQKNLKGITLFPNK